MDCKVNWTGSGVAFSATTGSGHQLLMDGSSEAGGKNAGARPMELLLAGLGGCSAFDVVTILKKARQDITGCEVSVSAKRAETEPKVFTEIHLIYTLRGKNLKTSAVERAVALSKEKYCSASIMLGKTAHISYEIQIRDAE